MSERFDVVQHVQTANGTVRWIIYSSTSLRVAQMSYESACINHPGSYFELLRVVHTETCVAHNGTPTVQIREGVDEGDACNVGGCEGTLQIERDPCYCAACGHPPCRACETVKVACDTCDREV